VFALAGCDDPRVTPAEPGLEESRDAPASLSTRSTFKTLDHRLAEIAEEVPGFGGLYFDENQDLVLFLENAKDQDAAVAAAVRKLGRRVVEPRPDRPRPPRVRVRPSDYDYRELLHWYETVVTHHLWGPGVRGTDIQEAENRIVIWVADEGVAERLRTELAEHPIEPDAVRFEIAEPIAPAAQTVRDEFSEVPGGVKIDSSGYICTLGFNATAADGSHNFVTASHCSDETLGNDNTPWFQPTHFSHRLIGNEVLDPSVEASLPGCPDGMRCRWSDVSLNRYDSGISVEFAKIARTEESDELSGSIVISDHWPRFDITFEVSDDPIVGLHLEKMGKTTGWTRGPVTVSCAHIWVGDFEEGEFPSDAVLLCQHQVEAGANEGDSGGPVFDLTSFNSTVNLMGVLWGRSESNDLFLYSPMDGIQADLGTLTTFEE